MPQERETGSDFIVSLRVKYPVAKAMISDKVDDTLNYASIYECVKSEMEKPSNLIENVAGRIADRLFSVFNKIETIDINLMKVNPPIGAECDGAGVELHLINNKTI